MEEKKSELDTEIEKLSNQVKNTSTSSSELNGPKIIGDN
mgnify:CR=1 FL=1